MKKILIDNTRDLGVFTAISFTGILENGFYYLLSALIIVIVNSILIPLVKKLCVKFFKTNKFDKDIEETLSKAREEIIKEIEKQKNKKED